MEIEQKNIKTANLNQYFYSDENKKHLLVGTAKWLDSTVCAYFLILAY